MAEHEFITKEEAFEALHAALAVAFQPVAAAATVAAEPPAPAPPAKAPHSKGTASKQQQHIEPERPIGPGGAVMVIDGIDKLTQRLFVLLVNRILHQDLGPAHRPDVAASMANHNWELLMDEQRKLFISAVQPIVLHLHTQQRRMQRPLSDDEILSRVQHMEVQGQERGSGMVQERGTSLLDLLTAIPLDVRESAARLLPGAADGTHMQRGLVHAMDLGAASAGMAM